MPRLIKVPQAMRLLTLNTLKCTRKDVTEGHLRLVARKVEVRQNSEFDAEFLGHVLPTLEVRSADAVCLPPAPHSMPTSARA